MEWQVTEYENGEPMKVAKLQAEGLWLRDLLIMLILIRLRYVHFRIDITSLHPYWLWHLSSFTNHNQYCVLQSHSAKTTDDTVRNKEWDSDHQPN